MRDPTQEPWYVAFDLAIKTLSAIGVIAIGVAGFALQRTQQQQQDQLRRDQLQARGFLPSIHSLAQLQIILSMRADAHGKGDGLSPAASWPGWTIQYLLDSFRPPSSIDTTVSLTPLAEYGRFARRSRSLHLPYTVAVTIAADLESIAMTMRATCVRRQQRAEGTPWVSFVPDLPALYLAQTRQTALPGDEFLVFDRPGSTGWQGWFPAGGLSLDDWCGTDFSFVFHELATASSDVTSRILQAHPDLAEGAVAARNEALKLMNELLDKAAGRPDTPAATR